MKKIGVLVLFIILLFQNFNAAAQVDTVFWFATPFVSPDNTFRHDYKLHIYTYGSASTTIRVRQPAALAPNSYDTTFVLGPYTSFDYIFWRDKLASTTNRGFDSLEVQPSNVVLPYGLKISSTSDISAVFDVITVGTNNPETFSLKGRNGLGLEFLCPFQSKGNNATLFDLSGTQPGIIQPKQQINIIASQFNTIVWITPKCNVVGHPANLTYSVMLPSPGSVYTIENSVQTTTVIANNLSGTDIVANNPVSVTVADDSVKGLGGCYDLAGDQLVPVPIVGNDYVIVKGGLNATENEGVYILGTVNSTQVTINDGVVTTTVINKGDTYFYKTNQSVTSVISSSDVYVLQLTGLGCEMAAAIVPPLSCAGSTLTHFTRNNAQQLFLNIYCKNGLQNNFILNNASSTATVPIASSDFTVVPGTATLSGGPYYGAKIVVSTYSLLPIGSYTISNSMGEFGFSVCNGGPSSGSFYHYMSLFRKMVTVNAGNSYSVCVNTNSVLSLSGIVSGATNTGTWSSANGTGFFGAYTSTLNTIATNYTISNGDIANGSVKFYLTSLGICVPKIDSIIVSLISPPQLTLTPGISICNNTTNTVSLTATLTNTSGGGTWNTSGTGLFFPANTGTNIAYQPSAADLALPNFTFTYTALSSCGSVSGSVIYTVTPSPTVVATSNNSLICTGQSATLIASGANTYTWNTSSTNTSIVISPTTTTSYTVNGTGLNGCVNSPSNSAVITQSVSLCTGINSVKLNENILRIYPNPNSGEFFVEAAFDLKIVIVSELGQLIKSANLNDQNNHKVLVTGMADGIYFINAQIGDKQIHQKIVVSK